jgi:hypothetical protein
MGIQSFTPSSGGLPGLAFINQIVLPTATRIWNQGGAAGTYTVKSAGNNPGYVYFVGAATTGGPMNGVVVVPTDFTSIRVIGQASDLVSLYKISSKTSTAFSTTPTITTYTSTATNISLTSNKTGFVDALVIGGGGGKAQHGGGGGAGGLVILNSFPLSPTSTFDLQVGAAGANYADGGFSLFAGVKALGGAKGNEASSGDGYDGGCGSGGTAGNAGGKSIQGSGTGAVASPILFFSAYGTTASAQGIGHGGGNGQGGSHQGGGGGGAGGSTSNRNGGPGLALDFTGTSVYYCAGGYGGTYNGNGHGTQGTGYFAGGYGMGGGTNDNNTNGTPPTQGAVIVRSYDF